MQLTASSEITQWQAHFKRSLPSTKKSRDSKNQDIKHGSIFREDGKSLQHQRIRDRLTLQLGNTLALQNSMLNYNNQGEVLTQPW